MKHAYLIIANRNHSQLQKLITLLDDTRNDIYLMIDNKSKGFTRNFHTDYSSLNYVNPINIYWGSYSQIQAELELFKAAAPEHYAYYHLLSGVDLPLLNQDRIHNFFDSHPNEEFITYGNPVNLHHIDLRIKHHLFRNNYRSNSIIFKIYRMLERLILRNIPLRKVNKAQIGYASQWVSIDDSLIELIIKNIGLINNLFKYGYLVDELFIPTLINLNPRFLKKVYYKEPMHNIPTEFQGNLRYINWWTGNPYIWRINDYKTLVWARKKGHLFSRKFDENIDNKIINRIFNDVMNS